MRKPDLRPICNCGAYSFPHKLGGGSCYGYDFAEYQFYYIKAECEFCNLNAESHCDAVTGQESIFHGECYKTAIGYGHVELSPPEEQEQS